MSEEETKTATTTDEHVAQAFEIKKIFIKDASFESPNSPAIFTDGDWKPEISLQVNSKNTVMSENVYEVILMITATIKHKDKVAFLAELHQAGIFGITGYTEDALKGILGVYALETLFPYARETLDNLVIKGGFPPLLINPINFNSVFQQQLAAAQAKQQEATH